MKNVLLLNYLFQKMKLSQHFDLKCFPISQKYLKILKYPQCYDKVYKGNDLSQNSKTF